MKKIYICLVMCLISCLISAQAGVGTIAPNPNAVLDITSTSQGFLIPRLTTVQKNAISNPAKGLMIFETDLDCIQVNTGTPLAPIWKCLEPCITTTITGNVISTFSETQGGVTNQDNAIGVPDGNVARITGGNSLELTLEHTIPQGTSVTLTVSGNQTSEITIDSSSDGGLTWIESVIFDDADGSAATYESIVYTNTISSYNIVRITSINGQCNVDAIHYSFEVCNN